MTWKRNLMSIAAVSFSLSVASFATPSPPLAITTEQTNGSTCKVNFVVRTVDYLGNVENGFPRDALKDVTKVLSKYPDICYAPASTGQEPNLLVFNIQQTPAVYNGTRTVTHQSTSTVKDSNGQQIGTIDGSTSSEVPSSTNYMVLTLSIQQVRDQRVLHLFQGDTIGRRMYGFKVSNRHPSEHLIEQAVKWLHERNP